MDPLPFALVAVSAVSHALWNYMAKGGRDKEAYMWLLNVNSIIILLPVFYLILPDWSFPWRALPFLVVSAAAETLYFLALGLAYKDGDLSVVYPLTRSSPMFVAILATLFLGEKLTAGGVLGILLIFLGVYMLHLTRLNLEDLLTPLKSLRGRASQYALLAALGTTVYSLSDKMGVTRVHPLQYIFWLGLFIFGMLTPVIIYRRGWETIRAEWRGSEASIALAAFLMRGGYLLVLVAMSLAQVSYILALRQVSVVLGAALGVALLKERYGRIRLLSSIIIFLGVYILGAFA